jgi:hypothetical protein
MPEGARGRVESQAANLVMMSLMSGLLGEMFPSLLSLARMAQRLPKPQQPQQPPMSRELMDFLEQNPELRSLYDKPQSEIPPSGTGGMSHWTPDLPEEPTISPLGQAPEGAVEFNPETGRWSDYPDTPTYTPGQKTNSPEGFYPPSSLSQYFSRFPYQETQGGQFDVRPPPNLPYKDSPPTMPYYIPKEFR